MSHGRIPPELEREMTPAVRAFIEALRAEWAAERRAMQATIDELTAKVDRLERELGKRDKFQRGETPSDSTDDPPSPPPRNTTPKTRGGQPGHKRVERELVPVENCREVIPCLPKVCRGCGETLRGIDEAPLRHQVTDIPEIKPFVIEYRRHRLTCECCQVTTCGALPEGVPTGMTGPQLISLATLLMALFRQSKRRVSLFCETALGVKVSPGLIIKWQQLATVATRPAYDELVKQLPSETSANVDETPTKEANSSAWIWTVVARKYTVFAVRLTKARCVITQLLGSRYRGVVTSDRAKMYDCFERHQWCWAHLKRDFEALAQSPHRGAKQIGTKLVECTRDLFHNWHRARDGTIGRRTFLKHHHRLYAEFHETFDAGTRSADRGCAALCSNLFAGFENLWPFANDPSLQIEPTNNAAERALRHPVIWKQLSFGTQSASGSRFVETLLSVVETCRQQGRDVLQFLHTSLTAKLNGQPGPSLLPNGA
jgi:transposase